MVNYTIMVQIADRAWTSDAVHEAGVLARNSGAGVALVKLVPVQHLGWLGTELGNQKFGEQEQAELHDFALTLEDYGVPFCVYTMQYSTLVNAIVQAAASVGAQIVFARLPQPVIPYWHRFQMKRLRHLLARQHSRLVEERAACPDVLVDEDILLPQQ